MKGKRINKLWLVISLVFCAVIVYFTFGENLFKGKETEESYKDFYEEVKNNEIESVTLKENEILYSKKNTEKALYKTINPDSQGLKEFLLLNGVQIKEEKNFSNLISAIFDAAFYIFFFAIILFVFKKFISPNTFKVVRKTGRNFSNVIGMEKLKLEMKQVMEIMKNPAEWAKKGVRLPKGILLEGDPGNGKTLFAQSLAGEASVNFIPAKATDFESMFMAIGPMKVKLLFSKARRKAPCIVFIDEFDGIGTRRNYSGSAIETENTRIVTALLNELDGFQPNQGILVIAATNNTKALDEALIRPGRFDAKYTVPYPDANDRLELIKMYTKNKKLSESINLQTLVNKFNGFSCAKIESTLNRAALLANQVGKNCMDEKDISTALENL